MKLNIPVYVHSASINPMKDWGLDATVVDADHALTQIFKIAVVPSRCTESENFAYSADIPFLGNFDLVIASDIENSTPSEVWAWAGQQQVSNIKIALGSLTESEPPDAVHMCYRPWWMYNLLQMNQYQDTNTNNKEFLFDAMLGARKPHRDFVMLSMQKHEKLKQQCLLSYREIFNAGTIVDEISQSVADCFRDYKLEWPYVSSNIKQQWEVQQNLHKSISPLVPWDFFKHSWYSIVCETNAVGDRFFLTEKTTKPLFAKRLFVMFSTPNFLQQMRHLGFETFGCVIDESYDYQLVDPIRWKMAFEQVLSLSQQNPVQVYHKIKPILEHNYNRIFELRNETQARMSAMLTEAIPEQYITM